mmetsp:Transcript_51645/g.110329  ORF Transcript_51645/g.110329 Transcript_51645/m.110329 type:complete len:287 (+) Transcript_51645:197-1057(+)
MSWLHRGHATTTPPPSGLLDSRAHCAPSHSLHCGGADRAHFDMAVAHEGQGKLRACPRLVDAAGWDDHACDGAWQAAGRAELLDVVEHQLFFVWARSAPCYRVCILPPSACHAVRFLQHASTRLLRDAQRCRIRRARAAIQPHSDSRGHTRRAVARSRLRVAERSLLFLARDRCTASCAALPRGRRLPRLGRAACAPTAPSGCAIDAVQPAAREGGVIDLAQFHRHRGFRGQLVPSACSQWRHPRLRCGLPVLVERDARACDLLRPTLMGVERTGAPYAGVLPVRL